MSNTKVSKNGLRETGVYNKGLSPGRRPVVRTHGPSHHQATVQKKWLTQDNICVMTCCYQRQPSGRGCRQRLHAVWEKKEGLFKVGEQRLCDQVQMIQKEGWLSQL